MARAKGPGGRASAKRGGKRGVPPGVKLGLYLGGAALILSFAIQGGEYGTTDLLRQRAQRKNLEREIDSLRVVADSLLERKRLLETDSAMQERIAREEFGMVRGERELLYRYADPEGGGEVAEPRTGP